MIQPSISDITTYTSVLNGGVTIPPTSNYTSSVSSSLASQSYMSQMAYEKSFNPLQEYIESYFCSSNMRTLEEANDFFNNMHSNLKNKILEELNNCNYEAVEKISTMLVEIGKNTSKLCFSYSNYSYISKYNLYIVSSSYGNCSFKLCMDSKEYANVKIRS